MVKTFNTRNVKDMDDATRNKIISCGVPIELYEDGFLHNGPANSSSLGRFANVASEIVRSKLPLPPSLFIEFVCDRTGGESKQDFRMTLDGAPGMGKSYTSTYQACRYAIEMADRFGQDPKDYFTLENCALLEDTESVVRILEEADKQQAVVIDDSGVSADSKDHMSKSNRNMGKIYQVCRTKRWFTIFNMPLVTHIDLRIRELVTANASIYKSFHAAGFNLMKLSSSNVKLVGDKKRHYGRRFTFGKHKIDYYATYSPDILDPYPGLIAEYDRRRDEATSRLIQDIGEEEKLAKNPVSKRADHKQELFTKYFDQVRDILTDNPEMSARQILRRCPGLTQTYLDQMRAQGGF